MPFVVLVLLIAITLVVRLYLFGPTDPPTAIGAPVMATGIFALGALQKMPFDIAVLTRLIALQLLVVWAFIAYALVRSFLGGTFKKHTSDPVGSFAIGTWVAGTAVLARLFNAALPEWRPLTVALGVVSIALLLFYLPLVAVMLRRIFTSPTRLTITGRILLATVAVQSIVVLSDKLFTGGLPRWLAVAAITLGCLLYVVGFVLIARRYLLQGKWTLTQDWDNTNCILHGAVSITGLASVLSRAVPEYLVIAIWVWAAIMFVAVEAVEIARMWVRVEQLGWRRGIFSYNVSQWARNFTFGMFYIFTLNMYTQGLSQGKPLLEGLQAAVIEWGKYIVLFFLLAEIAVFFWDALNRKFSQQAVRSSLVPTERT